MVKVRALCLFDYFFEDADIFVLQNLDSEYPIGIITNNQAVE